MRGEREPGACFPAGATDLGRDHRSARDDGLLGPVRPAQDPARQRTDADQLHPRQRADMHVRANLCGRLSSPGADHQSHRRRRTQGHRRRGRLRPACRLRPRRHLLSADPTALHARQPELRLPHPGRRDEHDPGRPVRARAAKHVDPAHGSAPGHVRRPAGVPAFVPGGGTAHGDHAARLLRLHLCARAERFPRRPALCAHRDRARRDVLARRALRARGT